MNLFIKSMLGLIGVLPAAGFSQGMDIQSSEKITISKLNNANNTVTEIAPGVTVDLEKVTIHERGIPEYIEVIPKPNVGTVDITVLAKSTNPVRFILNGDRASINKIKKENREFIHFSAPLKGQITSNGFIFGENTQKYSITSVQYPIAGTPDEQRDQIDVTLGQLAQDQVVHNLLLRANDSILKVDPQGIFYVSYSTPREVLGILSHGFRYSIKLGYLDIGPVYDTIYNGVLLDGSEMLLIDNVVRFYEPRYGHRQYIGPVLTNSNFGNLRPGVILHSNGAFARIRTVIGKSTNGDVTVEDNKKFLPDLTNFKRIAEVAFFFNSKGRQVAVCVLGNDVNNNRSKRYYHVQQSEDLTNSIFSEIPSPSNSLTLGCGLSPIEFDLTAKLQLVKDLTLELDQM